MNKIKIQTNRGWLFDWYINARINFELWLLGIYDDEDKAVEIAADILRKYQ